MWRPQWRRPKKKIDEELKTYFPRLFNDATEKEFYDRLRRRTLMQLKAIIDGDYNEREAEISKMTEQLITFAKPFVFEGEDNAEIRYDKEFEKMCLLLSQQLHIDPKAMTVLEFYNAFEFLQEMIAEHQKAAKTLR